MSGQIDRIRRDLGIARGLLATQQAAALLPSPNHPAVFSVTERYAASPTAIWLHTGLPREKRLTLSRVSHSRWIQE
jgi:hypothetical protein